MFGKRPLLLLVWLACIAGAAYGLVRMVPRVAAEYQEAAQFNPVWGYIYLAAAGLCAVTLATLAGATLWWLIGNTRSKRARREAFSRSPSQMTASQREAEIQAHVLDVRTLANDASLPEEVRQPLRRGLDELSAKQSGQTLEIVACGTISSGKSSLLNSLAGRDLFRTDPLGGTTMQRNEIPWPGRDHVVLVDAPGLAEVGGADREAAAKSAARDADVVLFVLDGPLRDFEFRLLEQLSSLEKRILVCLNKEDWFRPGDRELLRRQVAEGIGRWVPDENVVTIRARPAARVRVRVLADGSQLEEQVEEPPDLGPLAERLLAIVQQDGRDLLLANVLLRSRGLAASAERGADAARSPGAADCRSHDVAGGRRRGAEPIAAGRSGGLLGTVVQDGGRSGQGVSAAG